MKDLKKITEERKNNVRKKERKKEKRTEERKKN